jgi:putative acetyltransferase
MTGDTERSVVFEWVSDGASLAEARDLIAAFGDTSPVDLGFQALETELATLPGPYAPPSGGLLLVRVSDQAVGCCAFRAAPPCDYANAAEVKRLFVQKRFRGLGLGRQLIEQCITAAAVAGYDSLLLDTLDESETVRGLYASLGFVVIPPYCFSPIAGAHHLRLNFAGSGG